MQVSQCVGTNATFVDSSPQVSSSPPPFDAHIDDEDDIIYISDEGLQVGIRATAKCGEHAVESS
jgi:hypothetical protein